MNPSSDQFDRPTKRRRYQRRCSVTEFAVGIPQEQLEKASSECEHSTLRASERPSSPLTSGTTCLPAAMSSNLPKKSAEPKAGDLHGKSETSPVQEDPIKLPTTKETAEAPSQDAEGGMKPADDNDSLL